MKKTLLSRRGAAIELAMIVLALLMVVSIVLLTMASIQYNNLKSDISGFERKIELYEITDFIIDNPDATEYNGFDIGFVEEIIKVNIDNGSTVKRTYTITKGEEQILSFEAIKVGENPYEITSWK